MHLFFELKKVKIQILFLYKLLEKIYIYDRMWEENLFAKII